MIKQQASLKAFFEPARWRSSMDLFPLSGWRVVEQVKALEPRFVVDVGCGFNPFKGHIRNLLGIDLVNAAADLVCDLAEAPIREGAIDVVLALGSINFGDDDNIREALRTVYGWLAPGGRLFMRGNPGEPIGDDIVVFPWSAEKVNDLGSAIGFELEQPVQEEHVRLVNDVPGTRLFWVYRKPHV